MILTIMQVEIDEELEDCSIEEIVEELPEFSPRFVLIRFLCFALVFS